MKTPFALVLFAALVSCGSPPLPFEGHWTGTLIRDMECIGGGGNSADVAADWTITRAEDDLAITTAETDCPILTASMLPGADDEARMDVTHCTTTAPMRSDGGGIITDGGVADPITNTRTWTDGQLRLRGNGQELLVGAWEHDEGDAAGTPYMCDGVSFGALMLEGG